MRRTAPDFGPIGYRKDLTFAVGVLALWWTSYASWISEEMYEAVVSYDLLTFGRYRADRRYRRPTPAPFFIWQRAGLLGRRKDG